MNFLDFFFIVSGTLLFFLALDIAGKKRFNSLHILIFSGAGIGLLIFTLFPQVLNAFGRLFGIPRGADVLVYFSIIFLTYFVLLLLSKHYETKESITALVRELAIAGSDKKLIHGEIVFLIRAYNEASVIEKVIQDIISAGYHNILVVDDGSTDESQHIYKKFNHHVTLVKHKINRGAGAALETGFEYLRRYGEKIEYVVCFDADDQHDIQDLNGFMQKFQDDNSLEVVIGSRFLKKHTSKYIPFFRKLTLIGGRIFTLCASRIRLSDAHNGYRVFRYSALEKISLSIDGMGYASELTEQIARKKISYSEVPVNIKYTDYSLSKGQRSSNAFGIVLRFIWTKFFR